MTRELIDKARAGDEAALRSLYETHRGRVMRLAYGLLGDTDEAEDVMQDVMVYALTHLDDYDADRGAIATWLRAITVSRCRDRQRRLAVRARRLQEWLLGGSHGEAIDPAATIESVDRKSSLDLALAQLTTKQREALVLREVEGLSFEELGEALGVPLRTAQSRVNAAYAALRKSLPVESRAADGTSGEAHDD